MGKMAGRKVKKLVESSAARAHNEGKAVGFVHGLEAAAECKSIAQVRALAKEGRSKLDEARAPKEGQNEDP